MLEIVLGDYKIKFYNYWPGGWLLIVIATHCKNNLYFKKETSDSSFESI